MPMQVIESGLWLCQDCALWAVNADVSGIDSDTRVETIQKGVAALGPNLVCVEHNRESIPRSRYCDACRDRLFGNILEFAILGRVEAKPIPRKWVHTSGSTCSDDGLWMRGTSDATTIEVFEFSYWEEMDSSAVSEYGRYNVQSGTVHLDSSDLRQALWSCGWELDAEGNVWCPYSGDIVSRPSEPSHAYWLAECLWRYGAKDVACDTSGNNRRALIREAKYAL